MLFITNITIITSSPVLSPNNVHDTALDIYTYYIFGF